MKTFANKKILGISLAVIVFIGITLYISYTMNSNNLANYREISVSASIAGYANLTELEQTSDLIVIGRLEKDFLSFKPTIKYNTDGTIEQFFTVTDIKIDKILKGSYLNKTIPVMHPAALVDTPDKKQDALMVIGEYSVPEKGKKYMMFLKKSGVEGVYSVSGLNSGKFSIDNTDSKEEAMLDKHEIIKKIKLDAFAKYKDKLN